MASPCDLCRGACCEGIILPVKVNEPDVKRWLSYHGEDVGRGWLFPCKCSKLKNGKCKIYSTRPNVCREFDVGSPGCLEAIELRRPHKKEAIIESIGRYSGSKDS